MYVRGKPSILHKAIFELRYENGYTYLDRCGKTINAIMKAMPEWMPKSEQISPQNAPLVSTSNQCSFNFSVKKMDFSIEQPARVEISPREVEKFVEQVGTVSSVVIEQLGLREYTRIGTRCLYLFPFESQAESEQWISSLGIFVISDAFVSAFGGPVESANFAMVIPGPERTYRVAITGVEKTAIIDLGSEFMSVKEIALSRDQQKTFKQKQPERAYTQPQFAVLIDIDAYLDEPERVDPKDFVSSSLADSRRRLEVALGGRA